MECDQCDKRFTNESKLGHMKMASELRCDQCKRQFDGEKAMDDHIYKEKKKRKDCGNIV